MTEVAETFNISIAAVSKFVKMDRERGTVEYKHGGGRKRSLDEGLMDHLALQLKRRKIVTTKDAILEAKDAGGVEVSASTMKRALRRIGYKPKVVRRKATMTKEHKRRRLAFAKKHRHWTVEDWKRVIFTDESVMRYNGCNLREYALSKVGDSLDPNLVKETRKFGGGTIMVWGSITSKGPGMLVFTEGGIDSDLYCQILEDDLVETYKKYGLDVNQAIFQQDNAGIHTAKLTRECIERLNLVVMRWPALSPDLNIIEHVWAKMKREIALKLLHKPSKEEFKAILADLFLDMELEYIEKLYESMPRRIQAVIDAKGGHTNY